METVNQPPEDSPLQDFDEEMRILTTTTSLLENNDDAAQIVPHCFAPKTLRENSKEQRTRTSLIFVLFRYCLDHSLLALQFPEDCSTIWRLEPFSNASFHSHFNDSVRRWQTKIEENEVLRKRLIKQHWLELERLTYPLPKRRGKSPKRKRGYNDKGTTRPNHQRFRSDKDTVVAEYFQDLAIVQKVVVYGRRPTVTYRRLPFSAEIGRALELGLLKKEGDFIVPTYLKED